MDDGPLIIGAGELLWDCFPDGRRPGGAPANVAFHAQQLGLRGVVYSRVGEDDAGDELVAFLEDHGLVTQYVQRDTEHETGRVTIDLSNRAHPAFTIHEDVAWDYLVLDPPTIQLAAEASVICFGTLAQRSEPSRTALHRLIHVAPGESLIVYDVNLRPPWYQRQWIERSLQAAHIVKLNADEVGNVALLLKLGTVEPIEVAHRFQNQYGVDLVCITRGDNGCLLVRGNDWTEAPGIQVKSADAVGVGDAFTAALIFARLRDWSLPTMAAFANRIAALVASRAGAMPKLTAEFTEVIEQAHQLQ